MTGSLIFLAMPLALALNANAPEGPSPVGHSGQRIQEIYSQLNLSDSQKKLLEANKQQHREKVKSLHQEMKIEKEALHGELMKSQLDMLKINGLHGQIKALQSQMEDVRLGSILAVRTILTPEQFSKFVGLMRNLKRERNEGPSERGE